jgi:benzil reductase ((S)-benzoin forming)
VNYFFITGTSKGIGKALALELLQLQYNKVFGISRGLSIHHEHYVHFYIDLSDADVVSGFRFPDLTDATSVYLINNAGTLGEVGYSGKIQNEKIKETFTVNIISPAVLMNKFIEKFAKVQGKKVILNISSGAARKPIDGWSNYCASKAALDMLSETVQQECTIAGNGFRIFSIYPGVVDTAMQEQIRSAAERDFSTVEKFREYKESGELQHAEVVARKILYFLESHQKRKEVVLPLNSVS